MLLSTFTKSLITIAVIMPGCQEMRANIKTSHLQRRKYSEPLTAPRARK
jgi:hypothetical protein